MIDILDIMAQELAEETFQQALSFFDGDEDELCRYCDYLMRVYKTCPELINACIYAVEEDF